LFVLRGYLTGLEQGLAKVPEKSASYVEVCQRKADEIDRLVEDLFAYARSDFAGQPRADLPVDVARLTKQVIEELRPQAEAKGINISLVIEEGSLTPGDEGLIRRAIANLLDNGVRYSGAGATVQASVTQDDGTIVVTIADDGPGILPQDLPHLFEPLYRGERSRNSKTGGYGLGLSIAKRVFEIHGGDLTVRNREPHGALFSGRLPFAVTGTSPSATAERVS
jgi:signal transduction histidine kinase